MAYDPPNIEIHRIFNSLGDEVPNQPHAVIVGPNAQLHRYSEADEKAEISLGEYDPDLDTAYSWPGRSVGGVVDQSYVQLHVEDALLEYFTDTLAGGSTIAPVADYYNRIRSSSVVFKTNGEYDRDAALLDRDVAVGDTVYLRAVVASENVEQWTYVKNLIAESIAASVGAAYPASTNLANQSSDITFAQIAGRTNCLEMTGNLSTYVALADGYVNETYTFIVTSGSTGGDLTTAEVRVLSGSGLDDVTTFVPAAAGAVKEVGARGLRVGWSIGGEGSSCSSGSPEDAEDLITGQKFTVTVQDAFESATARSAGTYTGDIDTTYIVEVTRGGLFGASDADDRPQITVTTAHGSDYAAALTILEDNVLYPVGTKGVRIRFGGSGAASIESSSDGVSISVGVLDPVVGLRKGDKFYIPVTAAALGGYQTLVLGHNLTDDLLSAENIELKLYIKKDVTVTEERTEAAPQLNYEMSATQITVNSGITAYDSSWTDGGVEQPLDIKGGTVYVTYREWLQDDVNELQSIRDVADLDDLLDGPDEADNPLKYGVSCALAEAGGQTVYFIKIANPDSDDAWDDALETLARYNDFYNIVPLTTDADVLDEFTSHINSQSAPAVGNYRAALYQLTAEETIEVAGPTTSDDLAAVTASLVDDPGTTGTQYTLLQIASGNIALTEVAEAGDTVRYLYSVDGFGNETYTEFTIDAVINDEEARLVSGHSIAIAVPQRVEIWRTLSSGELAEQIAGKAADYADTRIVAIWPDVVTINDTEVPGYFACCALAGLISYVSPHQGLTNYEVPTIDAVPRTTDLFTNTQLNTMAESGVWILTENEDGTVINRHAITTDNTDLNTGEEMVRRNLDSIDKFVRGRLSRFIGRANNVRTALDLLRVEYVSAMEFLKANKFSEELGGQVDDYELIEVRRHAINRDQVIIRAELSVPYAINKITVYHVI
jgi:hypothetical protein